MDQWYYVRDGQQQGPVSLMLLRRMAADGELHPTENLVWNPSMKDWLLAGELESIFPKADAAAGPDGEADLDATPGAVPEIPVETSGQQREIAPGSQPIDILACVKRGCVLAGRNFGTMLMASFIFWGIVIALSLLDPGRNDPFPFAVDGKTGQVTAVPGYTLRPETIVFTIAANIFSLFLSAGYTRYSLDVLVGKPVGIGILFSQRKKVLRLIGASLIFYVAVAIGMMLLFVPALFVFARFGLYSTAIVDREMGVFEAFRYSFTVTTRNTFRMIMLGFILTAALLAGLLAAGVVVILVFPFVVLVWLTAYRWMQFGDRAVMDDSTGAPLLK